MRKRFAFVARVNFLSREKHKPFSQRSRSSNVESRLIRNLGMAKAGLETVEKGEDEVDNADIGVGKRGCDLGQLDREGPWSRCSLCSYNWAKWTDSSNILGFAISTSSFISGLRPNVNLCTIIAFGRATTSVTIASNSPDKRPSSSLVGVWPNVLPVPIGTAF